MAKTNAERQADWRNRRASEVAEVKMLRAALKVEERISAEYQADDERRRSGAMQTDRTKHYLCPPWPGRAALHEQGELCQ